jgi:hypothetical protein
MPGAVRRVSEFEKRMAYFGFGKEFMTSRMVPSAVTNRSPLTLFMVRVS